MSKIFENCVTSFMDDPLLQISERTGWVGKSECSLSQNAVMGNLSLSPGTARPVLDVPDLSLSGLNLLGPWPGLD